MVKTHLPISAYVRLNQLRRLKELRDSKDALSVEQRAAADVVFAAASLDKLRGQAIEEMVAAGYLNEEIMMALADPMSPYSILIESLKPESIHDTIRAVIRKAKSDRTKRGAEANRDEYVQTQRRLIDATWATLSEAGAAHHKSLLDFIDERSRAVAEAEGIRFTRAGRGNTKRAETEPEAEGQPKGEEAPVINEQEDPKWEEEFKADEGNN